MKRRISPNDDTRRARNQDRDLIFLFKNILILFKIQINLLERNSINDLRWRSLSIIYFYTMATRSLFSNMLKFQFSKRYNTLNIEIKNKVATVAFNRPKQLNALCDELINELNECLTSLDKNDSVGAIILTGS